MVDYGYTPVFFVFLQFVFYRTFVKKMMQNTLQKVDFRKENYTIYFMRGGVQ